MKDNFNWDILLALLKENLVIPIIGSDLILIKQGSFRIPLYDYITQKVAERLNIYHGRMSFHEFVLKYQDKTLLNSILKPVFNDIKPEDIDLEPLEKLAKITDFKIFISITFDDFLQKALENVRCQANEKIEVINFSLTNNALPQKIGNEKYQASIFNILGSIKAKNGYAKTEEGILEYFYALINENQLTLRLSDDIDGKNLLFIACNLPEWLHRFFIRTISYEAYSKGEKVRFIAEDHNTDHSDFNTFLLNYKAEIFKVPETTQSNSVEFVNNLYDKWLAYNKRNIRKRYKGVVFLSFNSEDRDIVFEIKNKLEENGVDVWYDEAKLEAGAVYEKQINKQIKTCKLFIAFISQNSISDKSKYVYRKEWRLAESRRLFLEGDSDEKSFIQPYILDETDYTDNKIPESFRNITIQYINDVDIIQDIISRLEPIN